MVVIPIQIEIGRPGELDDIEQQVRFRHDRAQAQNGGGYMHEHPGLHPKGRDSCRLPPLINAAGNDVEHIGTGHDDQQGRRHREGEQRGKGWHRGAPFRVGMQMTGVIIRGRGARV